MNQEILHVQDGIINLENYTIATPERAICDSLNLNKTIAFDNLRNVNSEKLESISKIYNNKRLEADVKKIIKQNKYLQNTRPRNTVMKTISAIAAALMLAGSARSTGT